MDFKFYVCIPIPNADIEKNVVKNDYMICEVIATLNCFDDVYEKTHVLYALERDKFTPKKCDDLTEKNYKKALKVLRRSIYVDDVIEGYNKEHPNSIQILPHEDNANLRRAFLNQIGSSVTLTTALCDCRDLMR